ncbi:Glutathione S-transferase 2 [Marasmius crinis-equi]|uniref:Glutathione S-transferase 2 n=1 Tax=Marasmius crinis-equi TaxID=585013 RepID=A0ABR3FAM7_9AGAR
MSSNRVTLYTAPTPNGQTASIFLEELKVPYETIKLSLSDADAGKVHNHVKAPWYLENINPNGKIPAIVDHEKEDFKVFETSAILLYLAAEFDKHNEFGFDPKTNPKEYSEVLQWLFFSHGGIGPMFGQFGHFAMASEKIPYAINRYLNETKRLLSVLDTRLAKRHYLAGDKYTIADIKSHTWVRLVSRFQIDLEKDYPNVKTWTDRIDAREAVQKGLKVPA